jgi:hypothetical protein
MHPDPLATVEPWQNLEKTRLDAERSRFLHTHAASGMEKIEEGPTRARKKAREDGLRRALKREIKRKTRKTHPCPSVCIRGSRC